LVGIDRVGQSPLLSDPLEEARTHTTPEDSVQEVEAVALLMGIRKAFHPQAEVKLGRLPLGIVGPVAGDRSGGIRGSAFSLPTFEGVLE